MKEGFNQNLWIFVVLSLIIGFVLGFIIGNAIQGKGALAGEAKFVPQKQLACENAFSEINFDPLFDKIEVVFLTPLEDKERDSFILDFKGDILEPGRIKRCKTGWESTITRINTNVDTLSTLGGTNEEIRQVFYNKFLSGAGGVWAEAHYKKFYPRIKELYNQFVPQIFPETALTIVDAAQECTPVAQQYQYTCGGENVYYRAYDLIEYSCKKADKTASTYRETVNPNEEFICPLMFCQSCVVLSRETKTSDLSCVVRYKRCLDNSKWDSLCQELHYPRTAIVDRISKFRWEIDLCNNNYDDDCDGQRDEGCSVSFSSTCLSGQWKACANSFIFPGPNTCSQQVSECIHGSWGQCVVRDAPKIDHCNNGLDDNCNNLIDEGCTVDLTGSCNNGDLKACASAYMLPGNACVQQESQCLYGIWQECKLMNINHISETPLGQQYSEQSSAFSGSLRFCNGLDDDCDGTVDEMCS